MKELIIAFSIDRIGGIDQVIRDYINVLDNNIDVVTLVKTNNKFNFKVSSIEKLKFLKKVYFYFILNRYKRIHIMHPFILKQIPKKFYNKIICWTYGIDVWGKYGEYIKNELKLINNIITISNFTKTRMVEDLNIDEKKIYIIPTCVDINEFQFKPINKNLPFTLLTVGRLDATEQYKGHDLVIKALALLKEKSLNIIYNIVGDGTDRNRLEKLVKDLGLDNQVNFLGNVSFDEIKQAYHNCHLFIMPSFYSIKPDGYATGEGFGIVYLEAGASGRAVIGCDVGGQTDYIRDGINGLLVKPDEKDIAQKIESLYGKFDLLEEMGRNGRKIVEEEFSMERFDRDLKNFLKEISDANKV